MLQSRLRDLTERAVAANWAKRHSHMPALNIQIIDAAMINLIYAAKPHPSQST